MELLSDLRQIKNLPQIDPLEMTGFQFIKENDNGVPVRVTVDEYDESTGKFKVVHADDEEDWVDENVIQEALLSRNDDGAHEWVIKKILANRKDGQLMEVQVMWDDGSISWEKMETIRKDDPIKLALYAKERSLIYERGWRWARKILKDNKRFARTVKLLAGQGKAGPKYKFGVQVPRNVKEAVSIDKTNGNTLWQDAMQAEIQQLLDFGTFTILPKGETKFKNMEAYTYVPMHFVFDVKFDLRRKARCVAGGNWTEPPDYDVYSGVVSIESVRIGLFVSQLNGLSVCAADVGNAFLHGYTRELVYTKADLLPAEPCLLFDRCTV
jgi:hypothetical protein